MRMTRFEWLARIFRPSPSRPRRSRRGQAEKARPRVWEFTVPLPTEARLGRFTGKPVLRLVRSAMTKSEARAVLKRELGLPRLPVGTEGRLLKDAA